MRPGREKDYSIIEDRSEQAAAIYCIDPYNLGLYKNLVRKLLRGDPPIELNSEETQIVLRGLRFVTREENKHPYSPQATNMLDEYEITLL